MSEIALGERSSGSLMATAGWAAFLACSWTWCIGMFLPVLLVRDFGVWGWIVFAVPNVLGAAAMGAVLSRPGASERLVARHAGACRAFSIVTIAFQYFFLFWMLLGREGGGAPLGARLGALVVFLAVFLLTSRWGVSGERARPLALGVWVLSIGLGVWWLLARDARPAAAALPAMGDAAVLSAASVYESDADELLSLVWLAPVVAFGFALCPYLDLTFHRVRQGARGRSGTVAFVLGFGVLFAAMITLSLLYAGPMLAEAAALGTGVHPGLAALPIALHISAQLAFTVGVHGAALRSGRGGPLERLLAPSPALLGVVVGAACAAGAAYVPATVAGLSLGEVVYRLFMGFYGLVFPAYVWILMIPTRGTAPARAAGRIFALAVGIAAPMFWMGFVERNMVWLGPGLLVVLASRLLLPVTARMDERGGRG